MNAQNRFLRRLDKIVELQSEEISISGLKSLIYDNTYDQFLIWGRTEGATKPSRSFSKLRAYSIFGPRNQRPWNRMGTNDYVKDGYVILFDIDAGGFRTFPFRRIEQIEINGQRYKVK